MKNFTMFVGMAFGMALLGTSGWAEDDFIRLTPGGSLKLGNIQVSCEKTQGTMPSVAGKCACLARDTSSGAPSYEPVVMPSQYPLEKRQPTRKECLLVLETAPECN